MEKEILQNYGLALIQHIQENRDLIDDDKQLDKSLDIIDALNNIDYDTIDLSLIVKTLKKLNKDWEKIYSKI